MNYTNSRGPSEKGALDSNGRVINKKIIYKLWFGLHKFDLR